jgi:exodeoxyribonuclease-3
MKLVSWNVNGVRAAHKKGLLEYMAAAQADVICLQEAKAHPGDAQHIAWPLGYEVFWNPAVKKGYSGTIVFTRAKISAGCWRMATWTRFVNSNRAPGTIPGGAR